MWFWYKDFYFYSLGGIGRELYKEYEVGLLNFYVISSFIREVEIKTSLVDVGEVCEYKKF